MIAFTANAISGAKQMYMESGFDDYMTKPINGDTLEKVLMEYIPKEKLDRIVRTDKKEKPASKEEEKNTDTVSLAKLKKWKMAVPELDVLLGLEYNMGIRIFI